MTCWQNKVATGSKEKEKFVGLLTVFFSVVMFLISFVLKRFGNAFVLLADYDPSKFRWPCKAGNSLIFLEYSVLSLILFKIDYILCKICNAMSFLGPKDATFHQKHV